MRGLRWGLATAGLMVLAACGGKQSGAVAGQRDLLAEDDVVVTPAKKGEQTEGPGETAPAQPVTAAELTETRCLGFLPGGGGVFVNLEERLPGEKGPVRVVRTTAAAPDANHGLPSIELGRMAPEDESEDEMFGDGLELEISEHLDAVNEVIASKSLIACQNGTDLEMGAGGFRRKVREVAAHPGGQAFKVSFRDGAVFAGPAEGAARQFAEAPNEEGAEYKLTDVWFTTATPGIVAVISDASSEQARRVVVYIPTGG